MFIKTDKTKPYAEGNYIVFECDQRGCFSFCTLNKVCPIKMTMGNYINVGEKYYNELKENPNKWAVQHLQAENNLERFFALLIINNQVEF